VILAASPRDLARLVVLAGRETAAKAPVFRRAMRGRISNARYGACLPLSLSSASAISCHSSSSEVRQIGWLARRYQ
jgi:hypothetical protein